MTDDVLPKGKKRYEPPLITSPDSDGRKGAGFHPAGVTGCGPGQLGGTCFNGTEPIGKSCNIGTEPEVLNCSPGLRAGNACTTGDSALDSCSTGTQFQYSCTIGDGPGGNCVTGTNP